jgi:hypothetical protein
MKGPPVLQCACGQKGWLLLIGLCLLARPGLAADTEQRLQFAELYKSVGVLGLELSEKVQSLAGKAVLMRGFMAPPLKPDARFFVLTRQPVAICPFCQSDADWPQDIVVVYLQRTLEPVPASRPIEVHGILEVGSKVDPNTGFVSLLRIVNAKFQPLQ